MKNKLQSLKSYLKKLKLIHILLIILIIVVFLGLFKKEINSFKSEVMFNMPSIKNRVVSVVDKEKQCTENVETKEWQSKSREINALCSQQFESDLRLHTSNAVDSYVNCLAEQMKKYKINQYKAVKVDCYKNVSETQFWAFGRYWFKIGN